MNKNKLNDLFYRLSMKLDMGIKYSNYPGTVLDMPIISEYRRVNVMPRMPNRSLKAIAKGAMNGNTDDMLTLSMMYSVGFGVERNKELAISWSAMSLVETGPVDFMKACKILKKSLSNLDDDEFCYPEVVNRTYDRLKSMTHRMDSKSIPAANYLAAPLINGMRTYAIYRVSKNDDDGRKYCYLYDLRVGGANGDRLVLEMANKMNIPNVLGEHNGRFTIPDYSERMSDYIKEPIEFIAVAGTLTVTRSNMPYVKKNFPEAGSVSELFDFMDSGSEREEYVYSYEHKEVNQKLQSLRKKLQEIEDGSLYERLRESYNETRKRYKESKSKKDRSDISKRLKNLKKKGEDIRSGEKRKEAKQSIREAQKELKSIEQKEEANKKEHQAKYPENLMSFVATEVYYGNKGVNILPVGNRVYKHLQSLGFSTFNQPFLEYCSSMNIPTSMPTKYKTEKFQYLVNRFSKLLPDYKVKGLVLRQINTKTVKETADDGEQPVYFVTE